MKSQIEKVGGTESIGNDRSKQQIPAPQDNNPRSSSSAVVRVHKATSSEDELTMANHFKLEQLLGDNTGDIEEFLKKFDGYVNGINANDEQQMDLLRLYLKGQASCFIDNLTTSPADLDALKLKLIKKNAQNKMKMDTLQMDTKQNKIKIDILQMNTKQN